MAFVDKVHYSGGESVQIQSGKYHQIVLTIPTLIIELLVDPSEASSHDDLFILESNDGVYKKSYSISSDTIPDDTKCTLEFTDLHKDAFYTLTHDEGAGGVINTIFINRSYNELMLTGTANQKEYTPPENDMEPEIEEDKTPDEDGEDTEQHASNMDSVNKQHDITTGFLMV